MSVDCVVVTCVRARGKNRMTTLSQTIAGYVYRAQPLDVPEAVQRTVLFHFLDTVGCAVAAVNLPASRLLAELLLSEGGTPQATAIGLPAKVPATHGWHAFAP